MIKAIIHLLILLVLFTHSTMAMDVHIPINTNETANDHSTHSHNAPSINSSLIDSNQKPCADTGGHCSHHQAHTLALVCVSALANQAFQPIFITHYKSAVFVYTQAPPLRPPKI